MGKIEGLSKDYLLSNIIEPWLEMSFELKELLVV